MAVASWHLLTLGVLAQGLIVVVMVNVGKDCCMVTTISYYCFQGIWQLLPILEVILLLKIFLDAIIILEFVPPIVARPDIEIL